MPRTALLSTVNAVLEIQRSGMGRNQRYTLDVDQQNSVRVGGFTKPLGSLERQYYVHPSNRQWVPRPVRRSRPDPVTFEMEMALQAISYLERHLDADSRFAIFVRFVTETQEPEIPTDYSRVLVFAECALESWNFSDIVEDGTNDDADVRLTMPINAGDMVSIFPMGGSSVSHGLSDSADCEFKCICADMDGNLYIGTEADAVGTHPYVIKGLKAVDGSYTWSETEISALTADIDDIVSAGQAVVWASGTTIHTANRNVLGTQSSYTAGGAVAALVPIDAALILAVGASGGAWLSQDGGGSWSALTTGEADNLTCGAARTTDEWYVGGENGSLLKYSGGTWTTITVPGALAAVTINAIALPDSPAGFSREDDIFIGCANGKIYSKYVDDDDTVAGSWSEVTHPLSASGSVNYLEFAGFMGTSLWIIHTAAGGASTVMRDWAGGVGGNSNVETVMSTTSPSNDGLNELVAFNPNLVYVVGEVPTSGNGLLILGDPN